jgi:NADPH2:quinone reductase
MRAVIGSRHGGPEVLQIGEVAPPEPGPGQLLVDVAAAGVNYMDIYQREGRPPYASAALPYVPGTEGAGTVAAVGPGVSDFAVGDRVAWTQGPGSYAEQVAVPAAAGGVGLLLTQMIAMRGGVSIATTSTPAKAVLAEQAGADYVTDYDDFAGVARRITDGAGVAAVYDGVGQATFEASLSALRVRGYLVLYGAASGPVPPFDLQRLNPAGSLFVTRPTLGHYLASREELLWRAGDLFRWITEGRLSVRVGGRYPLEQAAQAQADLASRGTTGKLLLLPGEAAA